MEPAKILQGFKDIADGQAMLHEEAMMCAQKINLNGMKRLHRHQSKKFYCHGICISNYAMDFGMEVKKPDVKKGYTMTNLKDHLTKMTARMEQDIDKLRKLNGEYFAAFGTEYHEGVCMQGALAKSWAKMKFRWIPRFEFTKWDPADIMVWDKWLHDKVRCMEEGSDKK
ncbi:MAG: hypothetical protein LBG89_02535 [Rickettsiales bacterium]|nr:hypothetical protein [Rickettsiales bacterium]